MSQSNEHRKDLSQTEQTAVQDAIKDVQEGFKLNNPEYTLDMLRKLIYITGDIEIIEPGELRIKQIEQQRSIQRTQIGLTVVDSYSTQTVSGFQYLKQQCYLFLKDLMVLLNEKGYLHYKYGPPTRATGLKQLADKLEYRRP